MKLITRDTDYAIRALIFMAKRKEQKVSVTELVKELEVSRPFLRKILQILNKKGIVKSSKGKGGGFLLANSPDKIFLIDVREIFQGPLKISECLLKRNVCPDVRHCILKERMQDIAEYMALKLDSINIVSLLN